MSATVTNLASLFLLGFFLGMRHATDADHVIAIATIVSRQRSLRGSALIGAAWGIGHTLTILVVGERDHPVRHRHSGAHGPGDGVRGRGHAGPARRADAHRLRPGAPGGRRPGRRRGFARPWPTATGSMGTTMRTPTATTCISHAHGHGSQDHGHPRGPARRSPGWIGSWGGLPLYQWLRPLVVGIVHGLAGSAAIALLVLTAVREPAWAMAYLLLFGVGTVGGMMLITFALSAPFAFSWSRLPRFNWQLRVASGLISFGFGLFLIYEIGFVARRPVHRDADLGPALASSSGDADGRQRAFSLTDRRQQSYQW